MRRPFDIISMTSSAVAQASWMAAKIWSNYPDLWPETVRALMIHSADWTKEMKRSISSSYEVVEKMNTGSYLEFAAMGFPV